MTLGTHCQAATALSPAMSPCMAISPRQLDLDMLAFTFVETQRVLLS